MMKKYIIFLLTFSEIVARFSDVEKINMGMGRMVNKEKKTKEHVFKEYAISTDSPVCSEIGKTILDDGGNAVDSAIAALLCLGAVHPHSSGIGGGGFMMIYNASKQEAEFVNFRETAPSCSSPIMAKNNHSFVSKFGLSVAVPGELKGFKYLFEKFSKLSWERLFAPTIELLKNGINIDESLSIAIERSEIDIKNEKSFEFLKDSNGQVLKKGDTFFNLKLAETFELISKHGTDVFYKNISEKIQNEIGKKSGCMKKEDLNSYRIISSVPFNLKLGKLNILIPPSPTSGPLLGFILNIFEGFNFKPFDIKKNPAKVYHALIETFKMAFSQRQYLSDPKFSQKVTKISEKLLSKKFANEAKIKISGETVHNESYYGKVLCNRLSTGTTHLVVIDKYKNVVSTTSTINGFFGAKFASEEYGFVYNNEMDDFCFPNITNIFMLPPYPPNYPCPGKRPLSSSVPIIILDDHNSPLIAIGGSGGSIITTATAQVLIYHLIFGMSLKEAIDYPRLHSQLTPDIVYFETAFNKSVIEKLEKMGHKVEIGDINHGVVQGIAVLSEENEWLKHSIKKEIIHTKISHIYAESDYRKGGESSGF